MSKPERIALIDMDGTIADYDSAMQVAFDGLKSPTEHFYSTATRIYGRDNWPDHLWNRIDLIKRQPGWWRNLPRLDIGFEIIDVLKEFDFDFHIATQGPSTKPLAWAEKLEWAREHMPYADVHITEKKSLLYGKVLVDDWPEFGLEWLKNRPRGLVIMPAHDYNTHIDECNSFQIFRYKLGMHEELKDTLRALIVE